MTIRIGTADVDLGPVEDRLTDVESTLTALDASTVPASPSGELIGDTVEEQLQELDARLGPLRRLTQLRTVYEQVEDFLSPNTTSGSIGELGWTSVLSGTGAAVNFPVLLAGGVVALTTGTTAAGRTGINLNIGDESGAHVFTTEWRAQIETLATVGEDFAAFLGLVNTVSAVGTTDPVTGFFFSYRRATDGANWQAVVADGSASTRVDTGVAVDTAYHRLQIRCDGVTAFFYIDDVEVADISTTLPTFSLFGPGAEIKKTAGLTARRLMCDWFYRRREYAR